MFTSVESYRPLIIGICPELFESQGKPSWRGISEWAQLMTPSGVVYFLMYDVAQMPAVKELQLKLETMGFPLTGSQCCSSTELSGPSVETRAAVNLCNLLYVGRYLSVFPNGCIPVSRSCLLADFQDGGVHFFKTVRAYAATGSHPEHFMTYYTETV